MSHKRENEFVLALASISYRKRLYIVALLYIRKSCLKLTFDNLQYWSGLNENRFS
jgi:hypothetical protein